MSLLEGPIQRWVHSGLKAGGVLLDVTVHKRTSTYVPGTGSTVVESSTRVAKAGFPDEVSGRFMAQTTLDAGERLVVLAQRPVRALGLAVEESDDLTVHRKTGDVRVRVMEAVEDPAQAAVVCRCKGAE